MMRNFKLFLAFLICFIFQSTLLRNFSVFGVAPNLILVLLIVFSFYFENYVGLILGVAFGMMQDIALGQVIGISALIYFAIGIGLQFVRVSVYRDNIIVMILISAAGTSAYAFLYWAISAMLLEVSFNIIAVLKYISVAAILNFICMVITVHFARKIKGFTA
jgi:rod shape-determining protein mreD